jgi:hypothetical protein
LNGFCVPNLHVALVHFPVVNKHAQTVAAAVTNLDLHDISRLAKTYGVGSFHVVTPLSDQQRLVASIVEHWVQGAGARHNPLRRKALELIRIGGSVSEVSERIEALGGGRPCTVATTAAAPARSIGYAALRERLASGHPHLLIFGTAWGLAPEVIQEADFVLEPVRGGTAYNHLSVRCASAIILDRLMATR